MVDFPHQTSVKVNSKKYVKFIFGKKIVGETQHRLCSGFSLAVSIIVFGGSSSLLDFPKGEQDVTRTLPAAQ